MDLSKEAQNYSQRVDSSFFDGTSATNDLSLPLLSRLPLTRRKKLDRTIARNCVYLLLFTAIISTSFLTGIYYVTSHSTSFIPDLSHKPVIFLPESRFAGGLAPQTVAAWDELMPPGRGFVLIEEPSQFSLEPGIPTSSGVQRYSVSVFHQLHCLGMIRTSYYLSLGGSDGVILHGGKHLDENARHRIHNEHIDHCFDFLRQALMCAADTTIESAAVEKGGERIQVDGWGTEHVCRDWGQLWNFMIEHQAPGVENVTGIA